MRIHHGEKFSVDKGTNRQRDGAARVGCEKESRHVRKNYLVQGRHRRLENLEQRRHWLEEQIGSRVGPLSERVRQHEEHVGPGRVQVLEDAERRPQFVDHEVGGRLGAVSEEAVTPSVAPVRSFGRKAVAESKKGTPRGALLCWEVEDPLRRSDCRSGLDFSLLKLEEE